MIREAIIRLNSKEIIIPDVSFLTTVALPLVVDLKNADATIDLLRSFGDEEAVRNPNYYGMFVLGSLARGEAKNGSDLDLLHVVDGDWPVADAVRYRIKTVFEILYGITTDNFRGLVSVRDLHSQNLKLRIETKYLDKRSVTLIPNEDLLKRIKQVTGYATREPYCLDRPHKVPSMDGEPHVLKTETDGITLPWWGEYGLVK